MDVTILLPCLNERLTLPAALAKAREAKALLEKEGLATELLVSDNGSTDGSQEIAVANGARVTHCRSRGYGNALIHGCREAKGRYILMGDSDGSYDFTEGVPMVLKLHREGYDLCMGSRFTGTILPGAMAWKNRRVGNPALTGILNLFFESGLTDAHCGLRALTRGAFDRLGLVSPGMEFASEMIVKASLLGMKRTEVPITLHRDGRDRPPHLRPWRDGWRHLKFLLLFSPNWLFMVPGTSLIALGAAVLGLLFTVPPGGAYHLGQLVLGEHWLFVSMGLVLTGYQLLFMGLVSRVYSANYQVRRPAKPSPLRMEHGLFAGLVLAAAAIAILAYIFGAWAEGGYGPFTHFREVAVSTTLAVLGVQTVFGSFLVSVVAETGKPE